MKTLDRTLGALTTLSETSNGKIFYVEFTKKDGSLRKMTARRGVNKGLTGKGMSYTPLKKGLMTVFDMDNAQYRQINLLTISKVCANGNKYRLI